MHIFFMALCRQTDTVIRLRHCSACVCVCVFSTQSAFVNVKTSFNSVVMKAHFSSSKSVTTGMMLFFFEKDIKRN